LPVASPDVHRHLFFMCACGCFAVVAVIAGLVYTVMHGLWVAAVAILVFSVLAGWFGKKAAASRNPRN
jgi:membrane protein implicated in regulation of membrane protease activity